MGCPTFITKTAPALRRSSPPSNTPIPRLTPPTTPNGIRIQSAVFSQFTHWTDRQTYRQTGSATRLYQHLLTLCWLCSDVVTNDDCKILWLYGCFPQNWTLTYYLHDAVYLYLHTVDHILTEGYPDYRDGQFIRNKTIGQRFVGRRLTINMHVFCVLLCGLNQYK